MIGFMSCIAIPVSSADHATLYQKLLMSEHNISLVFDSLLMQLPTLPAVRSDKGEAKSLQRIFFVRLSAQVYLDLSDFESLLEKSNSIFLSIGAVKPW
jgi:hypothetical protein